MKAGVVVSANNLSIFERHLSEAGYKYLVNNDAIADMKLITVVLPEKDKAKEVNDLQNVLVLAMNEVENTNPQGAPLH